MLLLSDGKNQDATRAFHLCGDWSCDLSVAWWHYAANMAVFDYISAGFPTFFLVSRFMKDFIEAQRVHSFQDFQAADEFPTYRTTRLQHWFLVFKRFCWAWEEVSCDSRRGYPIYRWDIPWSWRIVICQSLSYLHKPTCINLPTIHLSSARPRQEIRYYYTYYILLLLLICWTNLQLSGWFSSD